MTDDYRQLRELCRRPEDSLGRIETFPKDSLALSLQNAFSDDVSVGEVGLLLVVPWLW